MRPFNIEMMKQCVGSTNEDEIYGLLCSLNDVNKYCQQLEKANGAQAVVEVLDRIDKEITFHARRLNLAPYVLLWELRKIIDKERKELEK